MPTLNVLLFEDQLVSQLYPVTIGRPAFSLSCEAIGYSIWSDGWDVRSVRWSGRTCGKP